MIKLFREYNAVIDTSKFKHLLHDDCVTELENKICKYVGGKYACALNSATTAIFLVAKYFDQYTKYEIPACIPPVVANALLQAGKEVTLKDDTGWIGGQYTLKHGPCNGYSIYDSAQRLDPKQCKNYKNYVTIFSFYPTKPLGGLDGGMVVTDNKDLIDWLRIASRNGTTSNKDSWDRIPMFPGWKVYMSSFQAAYLLERFKWYDVERKRLSRIREIYTEELSDYMIDITHNESYHLFRIHLHKADLARKLLLKQGITCGKHYTALYNFYPYKDLTRGEIVNQYPKSEYTDEYSLSIPFHSGLIDREVREVINAVNKI